MLMMNWCEHSGLGALTGKARGQRGGMACPGSHSGTDDAVTRVAKPPWGGASK